MSSKEIYGYHLAVIKKGKLGEISKIQEELDELQDAADQGIKILELCELADLLGSIEAYVNNKHPGTTMEDLYEMALATRRSFESGER